MAQKQVKDSILQIRLTSTQFKLVKRASDLQELPISTWVRQTALLQAKRKTKVATA